ncbi:hypothetical protein DFQ00_1611, partial [Paenibacillus barcinonensis]
CGSFGAWVCGMDFEEAFQQTTPSGFMNTGTLYATPERQNILIDDKLLRELIR